MKLLKLMVFMKAVEDPMPLIFALLLTLVLVLTVFNKAMVIFASVNQVIEEIGRTLTFATMSTSATSTTLLAASMNAASTSTAATNVIATMVSEQILIRESAQI